MATKPEINEIWYVPVLMRGPRYKRPLVYYKHMATTRKVAVQNIIMNSYRGEEDWAYRKGLGWSIARIAVRST